MNEELNLSDFGEQCIKLWEEGTLTPKLKAYDDGGGTWTISWGCIDGVYKGMVITAEEAEAMFQKEIAKHVALVRRYVKTQLTQCQFDAAVSFVFNEGVPSGWVSAINSKNFEEAVPLTLMKYVYVKKKRWPGLVTRRSDELQLWHGVYEDARITVPCPYEVADNNDIHYADPAKRDLSHKVTATATAATTIGVQTLLTSAAPAPTVAQHVANIGPKLVAAQPKINAALDQADQAMSIGNRFRGVGGQLSEFGGFLMANPAWLILMIVFIGAVALWPKRSA